MSLKVSRYLPLFVLVLFTAQLPVTAQQSTCTPVSKNPLVMENLCNDTPGAEAVPAVLKTNVSKPAVNLQPITAEAINHMQSPNPPVIGKGDILVYEANRSDFILELDFPNGKQIVVKPLTRADAENTTIVWRHGRTKLDYPETVNQRLVRMKITSLHQTGSPLLLRGIKIVRNGYIIQELNPPSQSKPFEPPMSYPPDPRVMIAGVTMPGLFSKGPQTGYLAPGLHLPALSIQPMMMFQSDSSTTSDPNHYKFTGKELDDESGLYYFGARYYSPGLGRFVQPDPKIISRQRMFDPQQWNMYSYSRNNPTSMFDPDGREVTTLLTGQDYKNLVNALAQSYRKESFRSAFKDLKSNPMVHEFGKMNTTYTPVAPGSVVTNANPGKTELLVPHDKNGNPDFSHAHTTIDVDLNRTDAPHVESHEVEHGVQAQTDPAGYADASTKGAGSPEYDKLDNQAEGFADKVDAEKPTMSLKDATKEVQKMLPEPKPNQKKEDQK